MVVQKRNGKNGRYKGLEAYRRERSTRLNHKPLLMEGWKKKATELKECPVNEMKVNAKELAVLILDACKHQCVSWRFCIASCYTD